MNPFSSFREPDNRPRWFAIQVSSRKECTVATDLQSRGYECFLPKYTSVRRWSDRVKELEQPLFPGYLFSRFNPDNRRALIVTPGVIQVLGIGGQPTPLDDLEVSALQLAIASGLPRQPWPYLAAGVRVRVKHGSLSGLEGILVNFKGEHRVVISVMLLQRAVALEVDVSWIVPVEIAETAKARFQSPIPVPVVGC
jgi:transcription antitermination factor NusG